MELLIQSKPSLEQNTYEQTAVADVEIDVEQQYKKERNKPIPSKNHSIIQARLSYLMIRNYGDKFNTFSELELELLGKKTVPDISIFPFEPSDWENDEFC